MIAIFYSLPVREGAADRGVERFRENRGKVQGFPGFVSMEVLRAEAGDEVLVVTRWRDREACRRVGAQREELRSRSAPRLTLTAIA